MEKKPVEIRYYPDNLDGMWLTEVEKLLPWAHGRGVDIGCGARTIKKDMVRVDISEKVKPDVIASGDALPFKDGEFDFVCSIHSFEHFQDAKKTLTEWLRIIRKGGFIGIVHPDINYTKKQNPEIDTPGLNENPFNRHWHEHHQASFLEMLKKWSDLPFKIVDTGAACPNWSFYFILKKI
jgi:predicted SAM-dependent methyltransferase